MVEIEGDMMAEAAAGVAGSVVGISGDIIVLMGKVCGECASEGTAAVAVEVLNAIEGCWAVVSAGAVKVERVDVSEGRVAHDSHLSNPA